MFEEHNEIFEQNGVDKIFFYFKDSPLANNICTTCLLINTEEKRIEARGVSICSLLDTFSRSKGKSKASGRALKALIRKENFFKINPLGRHGERVRKEIKLKTKEDVKNFFDKEVAELYRINRRVEPVKIQGDKYVAKYKFEIPINYPIIITNVMYDYKSEFRPIPSSDVEINVLKRIEATS